MTQVNTEVSRAQFIFPQKGPLTAVPVKIKTEKQIAAGFSLPSVSSKAIESSTKKTDQEIGEFSGLRTSFDQTQPDRDGSGVSQPSFFDNRFNNPDSGVPRPSFFHNRFNNPDSGVPRPSFFHNRFNNPDSGVPRPSFFDNRFNNPDSGVFAPSFSLNQRFNNPESGGQTIPKVSMPQQNLNNFSDSSITFPTQKQTQIQSGSFSKPIYPQSIHDNHLRSGLLEPAYHFNKN